MENLNNPQGTQDTSTDAIKDLESFFSQDEAVLDSPSDEGQVEDAEVSVEEEHEDESEIEIEEDSDTFDMEDDDESPADDEDEDEEVEEDSEEDDETEEVAPDIDDQEFEIIVDGEELAVTGKELKNGYMRQSAFTKKTQELAEERNNLSAERAKVAEQANAVMFQAKTRLNELDNAITQSGGWEQIRLQYKPEVVEQLTNEYVKAQKDAALADSVLQNYQGHIMKANKASIQGIFRDMAQSHEGFTGRTVTDMVDYLKGSQFSDDDIMMLTQPSHWDIIHKAMMYDKAQLKRKEDNVIQKKAKVKSKKHHNVPSVKTPTEPTKSRKMTKAIQKQRKATGRRANEAATHDALVALFSQ